MTYGPRLWRFFVIVVSIEVRLIAGNIHTATTTRSDPSAMTTAKWNP